jgi:hypothetical protein
MGLLEGFGHFFKFFGNLLFVEEEIEFNFIGCKSITADQDQD